MYYSNKYIKYYNKYQLIAGSELSNIETELELYIPQTAGESDTIWPVITKEYMKNHKLGVRSKTNPSINFLFQPNHIGKEDEPILGKGTFTAVYELKNEYNLADTTRYILRLYMRELLIPTQDIHMMKHPKIINEYENYGKYLIKIYYYGKLQDFDYTITRVYNTPEINRLRLVEGLSNIQKFTFIYNNVLILNELYKNNFFHADYKISNVGWDNPKKMDVILIDYDINTIQLVDKSNLNIITNKDNLVIQIKFPSTYIPEYIKDGMKIKAIPLEQYLKYSVGGLYNLCRTLNIQYKFDTIEYPIPNKSGIKILDSKDFGKSLQLLNTNYDLIPTYSEMIHILNWIYKNKLVE